MIENKTKTKTEMLLELESIKGLLAEDDDIPILQETLAQQTSVPDSIFQQTLFHESIVEKSFVEERFAQEHLARNTAFQSEPTKKNSSPKPAKNTLKNDKHTSSTKQKKTYPTQAENPFLPAHIRSRLHGNNPPPLFEVETANKIASAHRPTTLLGNTRHKITPKKAAQPYQEVLINEIMDILLPEVEKVLREKLAIMSTEMLENLKAEKE
jgi:hypothetical protein